MSLTGNFSRVTMRIHAIQSTA